jgi:transposase
MLEAWLKVVSACYRERTFDPQGVDVGIGGLQCVWGKRGGGAKCPEMGLGSSGKNILDDSKRHIGGGVTGQEKATVGQLDMVLVPRIPTKEMLDAAWADALGEDALGVWRSMIEAYESRGNSPTGSSRMPRRVVEAFLEHVLSISMSLGSAQKCWEQASAAVAQPCQELEQQLKNEPVLNSDETGWRNNGEKRYLWALVARNFVFYTVAKTRSSAVLIHLLGAVFAGILCSDRFSAYFKYHKGLSQLCWAHLKRNILGIQDFAKTTDAQRFCRDALALYARLFRLWRKFQGSLIDRNQLILRSIPLQQRWLALAEQYLDSDDKEVRNMATALFQHCGRLFTFIEHPGVEPTNNCVEQALRIAVQLRKIIFGNRSAQGEVATARLLTVTQTCRMQGRNALGYLTEAIVSYRRNQPVPSLLPQRP